MQPHAPLFAQLHARAVLRGSGGRERALFTSADPFYTLHEWLALGRFSAYDELIVEQSKRRGVEPSLVKALVWRESGFHAAKVGTSGEHGGRSVASPHTLRRRSAAFTARAFAC